MIDEKKYEGRTLGHWSVTSIRDGSIPWNTADEELCADAPLLLEEVKRLREENETLRKMDWEYECLWTWLAENTNLLNTIEPLVEEWKKEYDEE